LRSDSPTQIGGLSVESFEDLWNEEGRFGPFKGETDRAARNFLILRLRGDDITGKVCLRPSGTEPKAKAYLEGNSRPCAPGTPDHAWDAIRRQVDETMHQVATDFLALALSKAGKAHSSV